MDRRARRTSNHEIRFRTSPTLYHYGQRRERRTARWVGMLYEKSDEMMTRVPSICGHELVAETGMSGRGRLSNGNMRRREHYSPSPCYVVYGAQSMCTR